MKDKKARARFSVWKRVAMTGLAITAVCCFSAGIVACKSEKGDTYKTADGKTEYTVEYGDWFYCPEINHESPEITVMDPNGKDVMVMDNRFKPQMHGEYVVTYTMGEDVFQIKVVCADTKAPEIEIKSITQNATVGDVVNIATYLFSDNSGVDTSKTTVSVEKDGTKITVSENEGVKSFVASEVGEYNVTISYRDVIGNAAEYKYVCYCVDLSDLVSGETLMSFDDEEFLSLISPAIGYEENASYSIATSGLPELENGDEATGGMLKIDLAEDSDVKLGATLPQKLDIYNDVVEEIFVRVYSEEPTSKFRLYNEDGEALLINKAFMVGGWHTYSFDPRTAIGYYGSFKNFYIEVGCEDATTVYIDSIYYAKSWRDDTLEENQIASYDSEEYLKLIKQNQYNVGAKYSFVNKEEVEDETAKAGIDGGALKVVLNSSLQGFILQFSTPIPVSEIGTLDFKVYMDRRYNNSRWGWVTEKGEYTAEMWGNETAGVIGVVGWQNYSFAGSTVQKKIEDLGASYVTGLYFGYYETATDFTATLYVDDVRYTPRAECEGFNEYDNILGGNSLITFENASILNNMGNVTLLGDAYPQWYNASYAIVDNAGTKALELTAGEPKSGSSSKYIGTRYTLQESVSILKSGKLGVGNFYVKLNMISGYSVAYVDIGGVRRTATVAEGENTIILPARDMYSKGNLSIRDVVIAAKGNEPKFQVLGIWYDDLKQITPTFTSVDEGTLVSDFNGEEYTSSSSVTLYKDGAFATKATVAQYSDYEETNGTKLSLTDKSGVEYTFESFNLKRLNRRIGNEMMIDVYTTTDLVGTLHYGVIAGANYYSQELKLTGKAEKVTLTMVMDDILESGTMCAGVFFAYEGTAGDLYVDRMYYTPYAIFLETPAPTYTLSNGEATVNWAAVNGATEYEITYQDGTVETQTNCSLTVSTSQYIQIVAKGLLGSYSLPSGVYVNMQFGEYDALNNRFMLATFDSEESTYAVSDIVKQSSASDYTHSIVASELSYKDTHTTAGGMVGNGLLQVNTKAQPWASWGGFSYDFPVGISTATVSKIGVKILYESLEDSHYNAEYIGVVIDGKPYYAKGYMSYQKSNGAAWATEQKETSQWIGGAHTAAQAAIFYVDVEALLAANPDIDASQITGVFVGMYQTRTYYVDSIFYTLPALDAPTLTLTKGDTKTTAAWTAVAGASGYEVTYPDGRTETVTATSVEFTPVNEIADVVKVRALGVSGVSSDSDYATQTIIYKTGADLNANEPIVLLDASNSTSIDRITKPTIPGVTTNNAAFTVNESESVSGKTGLLKAVTEQNSGSCLVLSFDLPGVELFDYVVFDFWSSYIADNTEVNLRNASGAIGMELKSKFSIRDEQWATLTISVETLKDYPIFLCSGASNETYYFSSFVGYNAEIVQNMIDDLPEAASVQESDRVAIEEARKVYDALSDTAKAKVETAKLVACEGALTQPTVLLDVSDADEVTNKVIRTSGQHYSSDEPMKVKKFAANQTFDGKTVLEITMYSNAELIEQGDTSSPKVTLDIQFALGDLSGYDYVTFDFYTTCVGSNLELRNDSSQTGLNLKSEYNMQSRTWYTVKIPAETLQQYPSLISTSARGETFYFTNFVAY